MPRSNNTAKSSSNNVRSSLNFMAEVRSSNSFQCQNAARKQNTGADESHTDEDKKSVEQHLHEAGCGGRCGARRQRRRKRVLKTAHGAGTRVAIVNEHGFLSARGAKCAF